MLIEDHQRFKANEAVEFFYSSSTPLTEEQGQEYLEFYLQNDRPFPWSENCRYAQSLRVLPWSKCASAADALIFVARDGFGRPVGCSVQFLTDHGYGFSQLLPTFTYGDLLGSAFPLVCGLGETTIIGHGLQTALRAIGQNNREDVWAYFAATLDQVRSIPSIIARDQRVLITPDLEAGRPSVDAAIALRDRLRARGGRARLFFTDKDMWKELLSRNEMKRAIS